MSLERGAKSYLEKIVVFSVIETCLCHQEQCLSRRSVVEVQEEFSRNTGGT